MRTHTPTTQSSRSVPTLLSTALIAIAVCAAPTRAATLAAHWQFEETSGSTADDSVASYDLDLFFTDLNVAGHSGSGIGFDGAGTTTLARAVTADTADHAVTQPTGDFSMMVWVRPAANVLTDSFSRFVDASSTNAGITDGYRLMTNDGADTNNFRFLWHNGTSASDVIHTREMLADTWTLLVVRYDTDGNATTNVLLDTDIVDAAFVAANSQSSSATGAISYASGENTNIGSRDQPNLPDADANDFDGQMDDLAYFSGVLTDQEIANAFNLGPAGFTGIPAPAALPAGLAMIGMIAARRRRK